MLVKKMGVDYMFCVNCGAELKPGTHFCTRCGQKIDNSEDNLDTADKNSDLVSDLDVLEYEYDTLMKAKECYVQDAAIKHSVLSLQEEIDAILTEVENACMSNEQVANEEKTADDSTRYCPKCGAYVGTNFFCGRCGNKIRG